MTNYTHAQRSKLAFMDACIEAGRQQGVRLHRQRGKSEAVPLYIGSHVGLARDCQMAAYQSDLAILSGKTEHNIRVWGRVVWLICILTPYP